MTIPLRQRIHPLVMDDSAQPVWVVKVGSALLTAQGTGLNQALINDWTHDISVLASRGIRCIVVSSGSIVAGMRQLGWATRPDALHQQQAAAAVGQSILVQAWEQGFRHDRQTCAQVLLTHADLANRIRYLNARNTLRTLLELQVVPVVNENDTVVVDEIRFGDNDTLAALVANLVEATRLVILTDQHGLFDKDPRHHSDATLITHAMAGDPALESMAGSAGELGRGGMLTKVQAAEKAARSGTATTIAHGRETGILRRLADGDSVGTHFDSGQERLAARKRWLAGQLRDSGSLWLDEGAVAVLRDAGRSLLPVGVTRLQGQFERGDLVVCRAPDGKEVARGLINYGADDAGRLLGKASHRFESILGYVGEPELIHRDNMAVTAPRDSK